MAARFVWPGQAADVVAWCKECAVCNRAKVTRQPATTVAALVGGPSVPGSVGSKNQGLVVGQLVMKVLLYLRTKGVKQKYLLYISSIGSESHLSAI